MKSRAKTALGIDISDRCVSAALVERTPEGFRVLAAAGASLPQGQPNPQEFSQERAIARVLRMLGRRARTRGIRTAVAVATKSTLIRLLDLPGQMPANVGDFVAGELRQCVALSGRNVSVDFCGVGPGCGSQKRLLAAAADAGELGEIVKTCRAAGITADGVEPATLACIRVFLVGEKGAQHGGHALVGVLGDSSLTVCLFRKGALDLIRIRDIPVGMETPRLLCAWLAEELNAVLRYCRTQASDGNAALHVRLVVSNARCSRNDIASLAGLEPGVTSLTVTDCGGGAETPSMMAVGAALKLLDMEGDALRIDLMPREIVAARSSSRRVLILGNVAAILLVAIFLAVQLLARTTDAMSRRIAQTRIDEQLYGMPGLIAKDRYLDGEISRMQTELAGMQTVCARHEVNWPAVLSRIGQTVPPGTCVTHLISSDGRRLSLKGLAMSADEAKAFVQGLDAREPFESVRLTRIQRSPANADVVEYDIECMLKPVNQECDGGERS